MSYTPTILAFAGSLRRDSWNKKLVQLAAAGAQGAGAEVTYADLSAYPLPLYDGDLEEAEGIPESAKRLRALMKDSDGFLIAAPEYNGSVTAALKNMLDWVSRPDGDDAGLIAYRGKVVTLMSASPGGFGGMRGLVHVRAILQNLGTIVLPNQVSVSQAHRAFDADGVLVDERKQQAVQRLGSDLATFLQKMHG